MLKDRLYYVDPYCQNFTAKVEKDALDEEGRPYVVLDNTAFYPTGGGQPNDTGSLNGVQVIDVEEVDGEIRHILSQPLHESKEVRGTIDWERRFDHMQQHAGQHILTAAFVELFNIETVSFHLGKEIVSIDLDVEEISSEQMEAVERLANAIVLENRPIESKWVTEEELSQYTLRKDLSVNEEIRLVIIPNYDYNGCGGTHPASTGQVVAVKILSTEKQKRKVRVHFVCGGRVLNQLHKKTLILANATKLLSSPEEGVHDAIQKLLDTNRTLEKTLEDAQAALLTYEAKKLVEDAKNGVVKATFSNRTIQELQKLARSIVAEREDLIVLFVAENDDKIQFVATRGEMVNLSMKTVSTAALQIINGKGGGSDAFVQGGGERNVSVDDVLSVMINSIT